MTNEDFVKRVTPDQIRESVIKNKIEWFPIRNCSICGSQIGYIFFRWSYHEVVFDSTCDCCSVMNVHPRSWEDVADFINRQKNEEYANECMEQLRLI